MMKCNKKLSYFLSFEYTVCNRVVRIMFFEPNREQAIRIQARLKELYSDLGGEYYSGEEAWEYLKNDTGIDLKSILERNGK